MEDLSLRSVASAEIKDSHFYPLVEVFFALSLLHSATSQLFARFLFRVWGQLRGMSCPIHVPHFVRLAEG